MVLQYQDTSGVNHKWEWAENVEQVALYLLPINLYNTCIADAILVYQPHSS